MKALTKEELAQLRATEEAMGERAVEHARRRGELLKQVDLLSDKLASGDADAIEKAQQLRAEADKEKLLENACRSEQRAAQDAIDADAPARAEKAKADRKLAAQENARLLMSASRRADAAASELVAALAERADLAGAFAPFIDLTDQRTIQSVPMLLGGALAKAGIRKFDSTYQLSPNGPNGFAEDDARVLAAVLPADDPSVVANRTRQEAIMAEHRRINAPPEMDELRYRPAGL